MYKAEPPSNHRKDLSGQSLQVLPHSGPDLEVLIADNNSITSLTNLPESLKVLSLARNKIAFLGNIDRQTPFLQSLNLSSNRLISLEGISSCIYLQELRLANNYVGDDQILLLKNLKNLKVIDVSHNHLRDANFLQVLQNLSNLEEIWNSSNDFAEWVMSFSLVFLKKLVLDGNKIKNIEFCKEMSDLEVLSCKENNVMVVKGLENLKNVCEIDLSGNDISEIPQEMQRLSNLQVLIIKNNSISELPVLSNLEYLDISHNSLTKVQGFSKKIKEVYMSHNTLHEIPSLPSAITLDISYNKIISLEFLSNCYNLQILNASYNPLPNSSQILPNIQNCSLTNIDLRGLDFSSSMYNLFISSFEKLEIFNGESLIQKEDTLKKHRASLRASPGWDYLSKSKLFPSCRSSLAEFDKNSGKNSMIGDFSIFSDIKPGNSLVSSISSPQKFANVKEEEKFFKGQQDSEYELLAKELEINKRISKLDFETRQLGDSLISKQEATEMTLGEFNENNTKNEKKGKAFGDSLISEKGEFGEYGKLAKKIENFEKIRENKEKNEFLTRKSSSCDRREMELLRTEEDEISNQPRNYKKIEKNNRTNPKFELEHEKEMYESSKLDFISFSAQENPSKTTKVTEKNKKYSEKSANSYEKTDFSSTKPSKGQIIPEKSFENPKNSSKRSLVDSYPSKDESTISFEISHDLSREKPPREPLKLLHDNHRSKKSHCCKHCHKKRKRSVNIQTTFKDQSTVILNDSLPKYIDQATSPMNSLIYPVSFSRLSSNLPTFEDRPFSSQSKNISYQVISNTNRSFFNETPVPTNQNNSFLGNYEKINRTPIKSSGNRSTTPIVSYRSTPVQGKDSESLQLINYACTPPRPILSSEANSTLFCPLSHKGTEYFLISQVFQSESRNALKVFKTYTFSLQKSIQTTKHEIFLSKNCEGENLIVFHWAPVKDLEIICQSNEGFEGVYRNNSNIFVTTGLEGAKYFERFENFVIVAVVNSKFAVLVKDGLFQITNLQKVVPVYLVEFH